MYNTIYLLNNSLKRLCMNKLFLYLLPVLPLVSCDKEDAQEIVFFPEIPIVNEEYVTIIMSGITVRIR